MFSNLPYYIGFGGYCNMLRQRKKQTEDDIFCVQTNLKTFDCGYYTPLTKKLTMAPITIAEPPRMSMRSVRFHGAAFVTFALT